MQCECGEHEATIHEVVIRNGVKHERHLCERCAAALGYDTQSQGIPTDSLLEQLGPILPALGMGAGPGPDHGQGQGHGKTSPGGDHPGAGVGPGASPGAAEGAPSLSKTAEHGGTANACPGCGLGFDDFRCTGLLGCARCYDAFFARLTPIIERAQQRGGHHIGKVPRRALERSRGTGEANPVLGGERARRARLDMLRKQLSESIQNEDYERAARVRDEFQRLCALEDGDGPGPADLGLPPGIEPTDSDLP